MPTITCPTSDQLAAFHAGRLSNDELELLAEHLENCASCQTALEAGSTASDALIRELRHGQDDPFVNETGCQKAVEQVEVLVGNGAVTMDQTSDAADTADIPQGITLGKYRLHEEIGKGGMGKVYKATHSLLKRTVAIKVLPASRLKDAQAVARFRREIEAAGRLDHPHIVRTHDADEADGQHFLVMEWLAGEDLHHLVRRVGPLPVETACDFIRQAARGLDFAHQHGMVHRDVKPSNLYLVTSRERERPEETPTVKVLDLGLALLHDAPNEEGLTSTGEVMGTYDFIAPEQALETHSVDHRADIYSLGCTFYFLLTGHPPFPGKSGTKKLLAHQLEEPAPIQRTDVSPEVLAVLKKMMAKDPAQRFASMREAADALPSHSEKGAPHAAAERPRMRPTRRPVFLAAAILLSLAAVIALVFGIIRITTPEGDYVIETDDPNFAFSVSKDKVILEDKLKKRTYHVKVVKNKGKGEWELEISDPANETVVTAHTLTIKRGEKAGLKMWFEARDKALAKKAGPVDDAWIKMVQSLPAEKQVEAVAAKLRDLNPGVGDLKTINGDARVWPGRNTITYRIEQGKVTYLGVPNAAIQNLSPIRALTKLEVLSCIPPLNFGRGILVDLGPLKGMKLRDFRCGWSSVSDLSPLAGMKLRSLSCPDTFVSDLSPLKGMDLINLNCGGTAIDSLSPLKGMKLEFLNCAGSKVADLSPLAEMKLEYLDIIRTPVTDLEPIKNTPLKAISIEPELARRNSEMLRSISTLTQINGKPAADFWKEVAQQQPTPAPTGPPSLEIVTKLGVKITIEIDDIRITDKARFLSETIFSRLDTERFRKTGLGRSGLGRVCLDQGNGLLVFIPLRQIKSAVAEDQQHAVNLIDGSVQKGKLLTTVRGKDEKFYQLADAASLRVVNLIPAMGKDGKPATVRLSVPNAAGKSFPVSAFYIQSSRLTFGQKVKMIVAGETLEPDLADFDKVIVTGADPDWRIRVTNAAGKEIAGSFDTLGYGNSRRWWLIGETPQGWLVVNSNYHGSKGFSLEKIKAEPPLPKGKAEVGEVRAYRGHDGPVGSVAFAPDGKSFLSGGGGEILHWDLASSKPRRYFVDKAKPLRTFGHFALVTRIAFSKHGTHAITGGVEQPVRIWDIAKGQVVKYVDLPKAASHFVAWSPDDKYLLVAPSGSFVRLFAYPSLEESNDRFGGTVGHFSKDSTKLLTLEGNILQLYHLNPLKRTFVNVGGITRCALTPDGRYALAGGLDSMVYVWDMVQKKQIHKMAGHKGTIQALAVSPDGKRALSGGGDMMVRLWDLTTGKEICAFEGHSAPVVGVAFSPDGRLALSAGGTDKSIRLWQLPAPPAEKRPIAPGAPDKLGLKLMTKLGVEVQVEIAEIRPFAASTTSRLLDYPRIAGNILHESTPTEGGPGRIELAMGSDVYLRIPIRQIKSVETLDKQQVLTLADGSTLKGKLLTTIVGKDKRLWPLSDVKSATVMAPEFVKPAPTSGAKTLLKLPAPLGQDFRLAAYQVQSAGYPFGQKIKMIVDGEALSPELNDFDRAVVTTANGKWHIRLTTPTGKETAGTWEIRHPSSSIPRWSLIGQTRNGWQVMIISGNIKTTGFSLERLKQ
ncbi:MAG: protein kinase [Planctomycetes bacterium]|nr:protein kinase [Planctomycetota bacterium]